ncbi:hypothetical protein OUK_0941 [Helicobacter pylori R037c]|nr:hypothetical protein OUK_0941 [Helicobacter pylori R037c]
MGRKLKNTPYSLKKRIFTIKQLKPHFLRNQRVFSLLV